MHDVVASSQEIAARIAHLRDLCATRPEIVSVYLNTHWFDEHQRDRTRIFLSREIHRARAAGMAAPGDLEWIAKEGQDRLDLQEHSDEAADVDGILTEAAKGGRAVAGPGTLEAARRGAIHRLYILANLRRRGYQCEQCGALQEAGARCWLCGGATREIDLTSALVDRVVTTGGTVESVDEHAGLAAVGGLAARLRYPLSP
ncbi:MAG: hypothetical protein HYU41_27895 [Candidatus Rokubacteria bacterium]|nr:hypothetical protein [Candidatus Rokubacteria bacterium]